MERGGDAQLDALRPHRVVVVRAVDAEAVLVEREVHDFRVLALDFRNRAQHVTREHEGLEPKAGRELKFLDRFFGRVHRDHADAGHAVFETGEHVGVVEVVRTGRRPAQFVVAHARQRDHLEAEARVDDRVVEADLVEALVQQPRQHRGAPVEGVLGGNGPPHRNRSPVVEPLLRGHVEGAAAVAHVADPLLRHPGATDLAEVLEEHRHHLELVRVGVHDGMVEARLELTRPRRCFRHGPPSYSG